MGRSFNSTLKFWERIADMKLREVTEEAVKLFAFMSE